jgi:hypothetical protein
LNTAASRKFVGHSLVKTAHDAIEVAELSSVEQLSSCR